jgi:GxxExxY protein
VVIQAALEVHKISGPGFLEADYEKALASELALRDVAFVRQPVIPIVYKEGWSARLTLSFWSLAISSSS